MCRDIDRNLQIFAGYAPPILATRFTNCTAFLVLHVLRNKSYMFSLNFPRHSHCRRGFEFGTAYLSVALGVCSSHNVQCTIRGKV